MTAFDPLRTFDGSTASARDLTNSRARSIRDTSLTMAIVTKAMFVGDEAAVQCVAAHKPGLSFEAEGIGFWLWGPPLELSSDRKLWREELWKFSREANTIIALSDPHLSAIRSWGSVQVIEGEHCDQVMLVEPAVFEIIAMPVTLSGRGAGRPPRPLAVRSVELSQQQPRFERATNLFAECGTDLTKLYMVMELIEKQHGGFPPKKQPVKRTEFCTLIQVEEAEWAALHRTARPFRHAEPHEDEGPVLTPNQARALIQHALKLWLERDV